MQSEALIVTNRPGIIDTDDSLHRSFMLSEQFTNTIRINQPRLGVYIRPQDRAADVRKRNVRSPNTSSAWK